MKQGRVIWVKLVFANLLVFFTVNLTQAQTWELQDCIDTALVHNKRLAISRNKVLIGEQRSKEAKANLIPKLTINGEYKYYTDLPYQLMPLSVFGGPEGQFKEAQFGVPHNINANLQLAVPLYNPQVYGAIEVTKIASELAEIQYQKSEEQIYLEISNLYYNAQIVQTQLDFIDSNISNNERLLQNIKLAKEQLLANGTDVDRVALQREQLKSQRFRLENKYDQVLNGLKFLMGISIERDIKINAAVQYESKGKYEPQLTLDILMVKTQNHLLKTELSTLKRTRLPSVSLFGSYGTIGYGYDQKPNDFLNFYPVGLAGLQVKYPLFNGTVTQRKIDQKKIEITNSEIQLTLVDDQNEMFIENAQMDKKVAEQLIGTNMLQVELAKSIYENTELQRQNEVSSLNDVLMADVAYREAQQNYLSAIVDYLKADLELKNRSGNILK
ncbi:MAG: OMF family outer membrane factor [Salibacteraceae bacterium]|jgi:OMF family outer membrane factor